MTRFLGNWEVETDIVLPDGVPFLRYDHPAAAYSVFLRNIPEKRHELAYLSMQVIFDAPSLAESKTTGEQVAKEFLDHLSFVSNLKTRLRDILQIFNWEPGGNGMRDCFYYTRSYSHDNAPYEALEPNLLDTIAMLQAEPINPRLRRALKWFGNGVASSYRDDQFAYSGLSSSSLRNSSRTRVLFRTNAPRAAVRSIAKLAALPRFIGHILSKPSSSSFTSMSRTTQTCCTSARMTRVICSCTERKFLQSRQRLKSTSQPWSTTWALLPGPPSSTNSSPFC
jgi:hypothetical protein